MRSLSPSSISKRWPKHSAPVGIRIFMFRLFSVTTCKCWHRVPSWRVTTLTESQRRHSSARHATSALSLIVGWHCRVDPSFGANHLRLVRRGVYCDHCRRIPQGCRFSRSSPVAWTIATLLSTAAAAAWAWNALPQLVRNAPSLSVFRRELKTVLFRSSFPDAIWQCTGLYLRARRSVLICHHVLAATNWFCWHCTVVLQQ